VSVTALVFIMREIDVRPQLDMRRVNGSTPLERHLVPLIVSP
jgi:hypothetical protein